MTGSGREDTKHHLLTGLHHLSHCGMKDKSKVEHVSLFSPLRMSRPLFAPMGRNPTPEALVPGAVLGPQVASECLHAGRGERVPPKSGLCFWFVVLLFGFLSCWSQAEHLRAGHDMLSC